MFTDNPIKKVYNIDGFLCSRCGLIYKEIDDQDNRIVILTTSGTSGNTKPPEVRIQGRWYAVDKIIADHFLEKPKDNGKYIINHKDGDMENCADWNLEFVKLRH